MLIERFSGAEHREAVIDALLSAKLVVGERGLAEGLAAAGEPVRLVKDQAFITEGGDDTDIYFLIAGRARIEVKGVTVNRREPGDHVGEIAALDPRERRSASVIAEDDGVAWKVSEVDLTRLAREYPTIWRRLAIEQAHRLVQRNALVRPANTMAKVFLVSSVEALATAKQIQLGLSHSGALVTSWDQGVFRASEYAIESLTRAVEQCDFAIAVIAADDVTLTRDQLHVVPRDNVNFELGLFMGQLGLARTILVEQRNAQVKLCSDLRGITTLTYPPGDDQNLPARMGPVCTEIERHINRVGVRR